MRMPSSAFGVSSNKTDGMGKRDNQMAPNPAGGCGLTFSCTKPAGPGPSSDIAHDAGECDWSSAELRQTAGSSGCQSAFRLACRRTSSACVPWLCVDLACTAPLTQKRRASWSSGWPWWLGAGRVLAEAALDCVRAGESRGGGEELAALSLARPGFGLRTGLISVILGGAGR